MHPAPLEVTGCRRWLQLRLVEPDHDGGGYQSADQRYGRFRPRGSLSTTVHVSHPATYSAALTAVTIPSSAVSRAPSDASGAATDPYSASSLATRAGM